MKIVINAAYGGFELSKEFYQHYKIPIIETEYSFYPAKDDWTENFRTDARVIEYIENFGADKASGPYSHLKIVEVPKGTRYRIREYDGQEWIETENDIDWEIAE